MFKVMIVDDEPMTRLGLQTLISWEEYNFEVVHTAANGNEALERYSNIASDLIIVDMRMPGMSGLELIKRIRKIDPSVYFIILSGHAEFEYAKEAITYNVEGYMLKPVDEDELIKYLKDINKKLEQKLTIDGENRNQIIQAALSGKVVKEVQEFFQDFLNWDQYQVLLIQFNIQDNFDLDKIKQDLKEVFEGNNGLVFEMKSYLGILIKGDSEYSNDDERMYRNLLKVFSDNDSNFTAAITNRVGKAEDLFKSYELAEKLIKKQFYYDEGYILKENSIPYFQVENYDNQNQEQFQLNKIVDNLFYAIEIGNKQTIERICVEVGLYMVSNNYTEDLIKSNFTQIISSLLHKLMYKYQDNKENISSILSRVFEIEKQTNINKLLIYVDSLLIAVIHNMNIKSSDIIVEKMIDLIERNYYKNIKLATLADVLNYNSAYLGKLFKDYTGEFFNTYLDKIRIEHGKKLLLQGFKVYEVAERIGYSNVDYFHSKFKSYEMISPSTYRKNALNK